MSRSQCSNQSPARARAGGFTLVELLVVIGIIAILVGILLPALGRAKSSANQVKCMSNLRSIGQAIPMYASLNKGAMPFGFVVQGNQIDGGITYTGSTTDWTVLLLNVMNKKGSDYSTQQQTGTGDAGLRAIFLCPENSFVSTSNAFITNYSSHPRIMPDLSQRDFTRTGATSLMRGYRLAKVRRASEVAIIFDGSIDNLNYQTPVVAFALDGNRKQKRPFFIENPPPNLADPAVQLGQPIDLAPWFGGADSAQFINTDGQRNPGNIRFRHNRDTRANTLMVDGHVESFSYNKATRSTDMLRKNVFVNIE